VSDPLSPAPAEDEQTLRVTISGDDRPGLTSALFDAIAGVGAEVRDLEQVVVRGQLTLAMLLASGPGTDRLEEVVKRVAHSLGLKVKTRRGTGDNAPRRSGRAAVVVIGAPLVAGAVASVTARIAAHGANIDRIRRLSRYPVTTVEFDISGSDILRLRRELSLEAVRAINEFATGGLRPDRTLWLRLEPSLGRARSRGRGQPVDRLEAEEDDFYSRIDATYADLAAAEPERIRELDANQAPDRVLAAALDAVRDLL
jgi:predicted amino acid-binding ACT domain protein